MIYLRYRSAGMTSPGRTQWKPSLQLFWLGLRPAMWPTAIGEPIRFLSHQDKLHSRTIELLYVCFSLQCINRHKSTKTNQNGINLCCGLRGWMNRTGLRKKDQHYETHQEIGIDIHAHLLLLDGLMGRSIAKRTECQQAKMWMRIKDFARHEPYENVNETTRSMLGRQHDNDWAKTWAKAWGQGISDES